MTDRDRQSGETEAERISETDRERHRDRANDRQRERDKQADRETDRARGRGVGVTQLTFQPQYRSLYNPHSLLVVSLPADRMPAPLYR